MAKDVIIDTDPGIDDTLAIVLACRSEELKVRGLTSVYGNVNIDKSTRNALEILEAVGREEVPVAKGCPKPLIKERINAEFVHGEDGIANYELPEPQVKPVDKHAVDFIIDKTKELGEVTLIPIGPLTNIALALEQAPEIRTQIRDIVLMGGAFHTRGNVTPTGEANIGFDPEAAKIVFESGVPLKIAPIDPAVGLPMDEELYNRLKGADNTAARFAYQFMKHSHEFTMERLDSCMSMFDSLAVYLATGKREAVKTKNITLEVETKGELTYGQTVGDFRDFRLPWAGMYIKEDEESHEGIKYLPSDVPLKVNAEVCLKADKEKFDDFVVETLLSS